MKKLIAIAIPMLFGSVVALAQAPLQQGKVIYNVKCISGCDAKEANGSSTVYFKGLMRKSSTNIGGTEVTSVTDSKMGESNFVKQQNGQLTKGSATTASSGQARGSLTVTPSNETKMILGYTCKKLTVTGSGAAYDIWFTELLPAANDINANVAYADGLMLEYSMVENGKTYQYTCTSVSGETVEDNSFTLPSISQQ